MQRRTVLATIGALALAGCAGGDGGGGDGTSTAAAESSPTATVTPTTTTTPTETESDGLPDEPGEKAGTAAGEFTESQATTPMAANQFVDAYDEQLREKSLNTGWVTKPDEARQRLKVNYVASEENQRDRLETFAESFVEVVDRTGDTGGWMIEFEVQVSGGEPWYYWEVRDEWAIQRLSGELSREDFYAKIEETVVEA